jgi:hypothetical protein
MVVVVAAAAVVIVWLARDNGEGAAIAPTTTAASSSSEPTTSTAPLAASTSAAAPSTSTSTSTAGSTSTSTTSSTSTTTSTTLPPGACTGSEQSPLPAGATVLAEVMGDFDGSGTRDDRFSLLTFASGGTVPQMDLSYGYSVFRPTFTPRAWAADARVVNLGGPADLAVVQIVFDFGRGAYLWAFHDCALNLVKEPDTFMMGFALVDGPLEKRGLRCLEDRISVIQATSEDGTTWWAGGYTLLWDPETATLHEPPWFGPGDGPITALVPLHSPEDDALIQSYANFDC